jgi:hypothetical protein
MTAPAMVKKMHKTEANSWIEITIHEGRKHQVKRMLEVVGHPVLKLERVRFGPLALGDLPPGQFRFLTDREANAIREAVKRRTAGDRLSAIGYRRPDGDAAVSALGGVRKREARAPGAFRKRRVVRSRRVPHSPSPIAASLRRRRR